MLKKILENREARIEKERAELEKITKQLHVDGITEAEREALIKQATERANILKADLEGLLAMFPESEGSAAVSAIRAVLQAMISDIDTLNNAYSDPTAVPTIMEELKRLSQKQLSDSVASLISTLDRTISVMEPRSQSADWSRRPSLRDMHS